MCVVHDQNFMDSFMSNSCYYNVKSLLFKFHNSL